MSSFDSKLDLLSNQIVSVIEENKSLKLRIVQLESKLSSVELSQSTIHSASQENLFSEFMDRQSRANNIILFNVPEPNISTSNAVQQNDGTLINDIFNIIGVSTKPLSIHRLGKPSSKPRPVRVNMPSPSDVFQILKVKRQLVNVDKFCSNFF